MSDPYKALATAIVYGRPIAGQPAPHKVESAVALRIRTNESTKWSWILNRSREEHDANFAYIYANALMAR